MSVQPPLWQVLPAPHPLSSRHSTHFPATQTPVWPSWVHPSSFSHKGYLGPLQPAPATPARANRLATTASVRPLIPSSPLPGRVRMIARGVKTHSGELS